MGRHREEGTTKRTKEEKIKRAQEIRAKIGQFSRIYALKFSTTKTEFTNEIRRHFRSSELCFEKHSIITHAIGETPETEARPGLSQILQHLSDNSAIFMTNENHDDVIAYFQTLTQPDFAIAGFVPPEDVTVPAGVQPFSFSQKDYLNSLGLPCELDNGDIKLRDAFQICKAGEPLTKNRAQLLKQYGFKLATFEIYVVACWADGQVQAF